MGGVEPPRGGTYYADEDINLLPLSDEDAPLRTLRGRVAVSTLTSGQQPEV